MRFREWIVQEAKLRGSAAHAYNLSTNPNKPGYNPHMEQTQYKGWQIYFVNRVAEKLAKDKGVAAFAEWWFQNQDNFNDNQDIMQHVKPMIDRGTMEQWKQLRKVANNNTEGFISHSLMNPKRSSWTSDKGKSAYEVLSTMLANHRPLQDSEEMIRADATYFADLMENPDQEQTFGLSDADELAIKIGKLLKTQNMTAEEQVQFKRAIRDFFNLLLKSVLYHVFGGNNRSKVSFDEMIEFLYYAVNEAYANDLHNVESDWFNMNDLFRFIERKGVKGLAAKVTLNAHVAARRVVDLVMENNLLSFDTSRFVNSLESIYRFYNGLYIKKIARAYQSDTGMEAPVAVLQEMTKEPIFAKQDIDDIVDHEAFGESIMEFVSHLPYELNSRITNKLYNYDAEWLKNYQGKYGEWKEKAWTAATRVIDVLFSLGLRKFQRVPIVFNFQSWSEMSNDGVSVAGYYHPASTSKKQGGYTWAGFTQIFGNPELEGMIDTVAHEIGHHVYYSLGYEEQQMVRQLANRYAPTKYASTNYKFKPDQSPSYAHEVGNEWFAEMVAMMAKHHGNLEGSLAKRNAPSLGNNYNAPKTDDDMNAFSKNVDQFKKIFARQSQIGLGYKDDPSQALSAKQQKWQQQAQNRNQHKPQMRQ